MFATVEEAEKAATMLRRFGNKESWVVPAGDGAGGFGHVLGVGHGEAITSWEHLADFLLARQDEAMIPARFGVVKGYLDTARAIMASKTGNRDQVILALCEALGELLRVRG